MKYFKILPFLLLGLFLTACSQEEAQPSSETNAATFDFSFVADTKNPNISRFEFSVPEDPMQLVITETIYSSNHDAIESVVLTAPIANKTGELIVEQKTDEDLTRLIFQVLSDGEVTTGSPFPFHPESFLVYGPNTIESQARQGNFFAYKGTPATNEQGQVSFSTELFQEAFDLPNSLKTEEVAVVWSYAFLPE
ncbi:hypothetical protein ACYSNO_08440 [Enterococcus sp. LJL98]